MESLVPSAVPLVHETSSATIDGNTTASSLMEDIEQSSSSVCGLADGTSSANSESSDSELFRMKSRVGLLTNS